MNASNSLNYSEERLKLLDRLMRDGVNLKEAGTWLLSSSNLRFCLGKSMSELKIPYHMGHKDEGIIRKSILSLTLLLKQRMESPSAQRVEAEGISIDEIRMKLPIMEKTYRTNMFVNNSIEKRLVSEMLFCLPYLDSGILRNWLVVDGYAMAYLKMAMRILDKAIIEELKGDSGEKTSYLALLSIINTTSEKKKLLKKISIKGITYEKLESVIGMAHFFLLREAVREAISSQKKAGIRYTKYDPEPLLISSLLPASMVYITSAVLTTIINPYGINIEAYKILSSLYTEDPGEKGDLSSAREALLKKVEDDQSAQNKLAAIARLSEARRTIIRYLMDYDNPAMETNRELQDLCQFDRLLYNVMSDPRKAERLNKGLKSLAQKFKDDPQRTEYIESIRGFIAIQKKSSFLSWRSEKSADNTGSVQNIVTGFVAYKLDEGISAFTKLMKGALVDRRADLSDDALKAEYNMGRLYRFSVDNTPILKTLQIEEEGFLFVDMKDFTKKTFQVKEIAMADFIKYNFYIPMLEAASRYKRGTGLAEDVRGIRLENLIGDAAVFSGGVVYLVSLARDIQRITAKYRDALKEKILPQVKEMADEDILIESGLFLSYGKRAETVIIQGMEDFFDEAKVAIGEKINEAARGTGRSSIVKAKMDILIQRERERKGQPRLEYPFNVYTAKTYNLKMTPEMDFQINELVEKGDVQKIKALVKNIADSYYADIEKMVSGVPPKDLNLISCVSEIYNKGQALSGEALKAYMEETKENRAFFRKIVPVSELHQEIRDSYYFQNDSLCLLFGVGRGEKGLDVDIFVKRGEVVFKGFEEASPTAVYEILDRGGDFSKKIMKYHFPMWQPAADMKDIDNFFD